MDRSSLTRAFTLIELLVVCGIMVIVTSLILANNNEYGGQVLLQNFAYDVALSVRQAQVYGISVQRFGTGSSSVFSAGYGVDFNMSTPSTYNIFADAVNPNGLYDCTQPGVSCELVSAEAINRGYSISKLCAPAGNDAATCTSVSRVDVLFLRPEPDALITSCGSSCSTSCLLNGSACAASARVVLQSPRGDTMSVSIQANGQIAVDQKSVIAP
jgi:Tfp pilus assembly protein FimT